MNKNAKECQDTFTRGVGHGVNLIFVKLFNEETDKRDLLMAIYGKASSLEKKETNELEKARLEAYSEGVRHCLNILTNLGPAREAHNNIIKPTIKVEITDEDIVMFR